MELLVPRKKVLADLRVKQPDSSRIQLGISYSSLTMIWLKKWGICCKDKRIFQSQPVQNWKTVSGMLAPSDNSAMFAKEVVEHHLLGWVKLKVHFLISFQSILSQKKYIHQIQNWMKIDI